MTIHLSQSTWAALFEEYNQAFHTLTTADELTRAVNNARALADYVSQVAPVSADGTQVLHYGITWTPVDNDTPYPDLEDLTEAWYGTQHGGRIEVSDCWHDHPVFSRNENLSFRVWHDTDHVRSQLSFDRDAEVELFVWQAREFTEPAHVEALFCESVYQLSAAVVLGTYPDHQAVRTPGPVGRALLDAWGF